MLVDMASATKRTRSAAPAASAGAPDRARARPAPRRRHFDHGDGRGQSAVLRLRPSARPRTRGRRRRTAPRPSMIRLSELKFRACEGYYSKSAHACTWPCSITQMDDKRPDGPGLRGAGALGRRRHRRHADPLGRGLLALFQDGRAAQLRAERDHDPQPGADPQQGRGLHHRRRPGQHPGRRRPDARLLRRTRLHLPAVSLHRPFARLVERGHGAQRRDRAPFRGTRRRRGDAGEALPRSCRGT